MTSFKPLLRYLKYPLMWVMLLWALTLPGHEVLVYTFLVKGSVTEAAAHLAIAASAKDTAVKQQAVQAFTDAHTSSPVVISPQAVAKYMLQVMAFAPPADEPAPAAAANPTAPRLISLLFPGLIQPNAP